ncbi:MAG: insulinase family protein [Chloroflexia bacterium]|nr:insulinase family protein [Chloroflexia bacterium]
MHQRTVLDNGLRVLTCPMPHVRSATVCLFIQVGARLDPPERAGLAHFLEHMVFKGTRSYPGGRYLSEAIEGVGGMLDASTSAEVTAYWAKVPQQHFSQAVDVLTEMLRRPLLLPAEVEKERQVIMEELRMINDSPADWTFRLIGELLWPDSALGQDVAGTEEGVAAIEASDLQGYLQNWYAPNRVIAVVAGAPPPEQVEQAMAAALGDLEPLPAPQAAALPEDPAGPRFRLGYREIEQANLCLAWPALSYHHPDRYVLLLLNTILGAGMSSRLFQSVREDRALAYSVFSTLRQYADTGALLVYAGIQPSRLFECLAAIWDELQRLGQEDVVEEELARAKEYNKGRMLLRLEDSYGVASWYGMQETLLERIWEVDRVIAEIESIQPADLRRLAQELLRPERLRLAVVGPIQDEQSLGQALGIESVDAGDP